MMEYAIVRKYENNQYYRCAYTKDGDNITLGDLTPVYIVEVTDAELKALNALKTINGGNFEAIDANYQTKIDKEITLNGEIEGLNTVITNLTTERNSSIHNQYKCGHYFWS